MTFVNEKITKEDVEGYGLASVSNQFVVGRVPPTTWTIDRERNMYLRVVSRGREEFYYQSTWTFFWKGDLIVFNLDFLSSSGEVDEDQVGHKRLYNFRMPDKVKFVKDEMLADLRSALETYKDGGVYATAKSYELKLDIEL